MKETRDKLEVERDMKLDAFDNVRRLKSQMFSMDDPLEQESGFVSGGMGSNRASRLDSVPSHFGLSQRAHTSLGYNRDIKSARSTSQVKRNGRPLAVTSNYFLIEISNQAMIAVSSGHTFAVA